MVVSSQNANRDWLYYWQQTVSAEGFSGQAFSPYVPHTVRAKETKSCTDCHVSNDDRQQRLDGASAAHAGHELRELHGPHTSGSPTGEKGFEAVAVAERDEPPAIIGSDLHKLAYPERLRETRRKTTAN